MHKDCTTQKLSRSSGFSLIELQLYIAIMMFMVVMVCHIALNYHILYDKTALRAQKSVALLAAIRCVSDTFSKAVMEQKKEINFSSGSFLKKGQLFAGIGKQKMVLLENVTTFDTIIDMRDTMVCGSTFVCVYGTHVISWYQAAPTKAFSCSYSL